MNSKINELFFEDGEAFMFVNDVDDMFDLSDYMCGFHRISISMSNENLNGKKVLKVCFGDLVDPVKLKSALDSYFEEMNIQS
ncbi:hypothetical protein G3R49_14185 [Shewanella sp. WXL01]|uniref:Uncharacterized protein n=1 Tax=Shewanella maritima TaxID=2520507 RepID=A0A411PL15_9GAMM|nr:MULTISPECIES: hypothetical protein [Shewanella]NKF51711.1 hypothetical protein [Shewanella sp. WXL01]QBF84225.1 hypothetical protein EXU30_17260 [Shewanella maritima]